MTEIITFAGVQKLVDRFKEGKQLPDNWKELINDYIRRKIRLIRKMKPSKPINREDLEFLKKVSEGMNLNQADKYPEKIAKLGDYIGYMHKERKLFLNPDGQDILAHPEKYLGKKRGKEWMQLEEAKNIRKNLMRMHG